MSKNGSNWKSYGKSNRDFMPKSLIKSNKSTFLLNQENEIRIENVALFSEELEINEHVVELWNMLRRIAKTVFFFTAIILVTPGMENRRLTIDPYQPGILILLNYLIQYSLDAINQGKTNTQIFLGSPLTPISLYLNLAFFVAVLVSLPVIVRELVNFVKPGLNYKEFQAVKTATGYAAILFLIGVLVSYFIILPITLRLLVFAGGKIGGPSVLQLYSLSSILSILLWGTLGGGLLYTSPMILVLLVNLRIIRAEQISNRRKEIITTIFFIAAIITPDPTMVSMVVLSLPLIFIIEGVIIWSYKFQLKQIINHGGITYYG